MFQHLLVLSGPDAVLGMTFFCSHSVDCQPYLPGLAYFEDLQPWKQELLHPHFTDEETKAQRN